jgi:hypothetical protein
MTPELPSQPPWLSLETQALARLLLLSHQQAFSKPLIAGLASDTSPGLAAQELFAAEVVVLAHDGANPCGDPGPRLIYANRAALRLWQHPWGGMVGMPSQLTAAPTERASRSLALAKAQDQGALQGYRGVRVNSQGRRFQIVNARLWTLRDEYNQACGQAAAFNSWWWL